MAKLAQRLRLNLTDTLTSNVELLSNLLKRALAAILQAKAQRKHLLFTRGKRIKLSLIHISEPTRRS